MNPGEFFSIRKYHGSAIIKTIKIPKSQGNWRIFFGETLNLTSQKKIGGIVNTPTIGPFDNNPKPIPTKKRPPQRVLFFP